MRTSRLVALIGVLALLAPACASAPPAPSGPAYPDLPSPDIPPRMSVAADLREKHQLAWQRLQAGDKRAAAREYAEVLKRSPAFYPAETGLGLIALAEGQYRNAVVRFQAAITRDSRYVPAWRGLVSAEIAQEHLEEASSALEHLLALDPSRDWDRTRLEMLKVRRVQQLADAGRRARAAGKFEEAADSFSRALALAPNSPTILRELALVELASGRTAEAEARVRRALQLDPADDDTLGALGAVLEKSGKMRESAAAYAKAAAIDSKWREKADSARAAAEASGVPDELRELGAATSVTRAQLAALVGLRLGPLLERAPKRAPPVATDVRANWAAAWITPVTQAGVMEVFANHTFQPAAPVQRGDLAQVVSRLLALASADRVPDLPGWQAARPSLADVAPANVYYRSASLAVSAGVMKTDDTGRFLPTRPAAGADVLAAIARLQQLAGR